MTARDVMETRFQTLRPETPVAEAVRLFEQASQAQGQTVFGMMVTEESGRLVGMLSILTLSPQGGGNNSDFFFKVFLKHETRSYCKTSISPNRSF